MMQPDADVIPQTDSMLTRLCREQREEDLQRLRTEEFDIIVVGGGITGVGAALDAVSRGLKVALIEAHDFASGTSSKSSKLIHGGLRYLEMLDFGLVKEALAERQRLLGRIAPHLVQPVRFVWPLQHRGWERAYLTAGLTLYDTMAGRGAVPRHRHLTRDGLQGIASGFNRNAHYGGVAFFDACEDDARMVATIARTARGLGAAVISGARAGDTRQDEDGSRIVEIMLDSGEVIQARTQHLSYATGPFSDQQAVSSSLTVRPSKGVHIMVPRDRIDAEIGVLTRTEKSVLFIIPWLNHWLIGDTDTDWPYDRSTPVASSGDVDYLLQKANALLDPPLTRDDVVGVFAGLRPLVQTDPNADTTRLSREHSIVVPSPGVTAIAGGKYTTYRVMARDLIDVAVRESGLTVGPSVTENLPLLGAKKYHALRKRRDQLASQYGLKSSTIDHLLHRYGDETVHLLEEGERQNLNVPVPGYDPYLWIELRYAFSHEGARTLADVLERRTRIKIQYRDSGAAIAEHTADFAVEVLGWDESERSRQIAAYQKTLEAEAEALTQPDDASALRAYQQVFES